MDRKATYGEYLSSVNQRYNKLSEDVGDDFPALNNITVRGALPSDMIPAPSKLKVMSIY